MADSGAGIGISPPNSGMHDTIKAVEIDQAGHPPRLSGPCVHLNRALSLFVAQLRTRGRGCGTAVTAASVWTRRQPAEARPAINTDFNNSSITYRHSPQLG